MDSYQDYLDKKHAKFVTPQGVMGKVIKKAVNKKVLNFRKIVAGEDNEVYDLEIDGGKNLIIRISRYEPRSFQTEALILKKVKEVGVPVPEVLLVDTEKVNDQELTFCVEEKINGISLDKLLNNIDKSTLKKLLSDSGGYLSMINSLTMDHFGEISEEGYDTWKDFLVSKVKNISMIEKAAKYGDISLEIVDKALNILVNHIDLLIIPSPYLLHDDFHPKHILVQNDKVVGIIDFEDAKGGDPIRDIARVEYYCQDYFPLKWVLNGYRNKEIFDSNFNKKILLYKINFGLDLLRYYFLHKHIHGMRHVKSMLEQDVHNFY